MDLLQFKKTKSSVISKGRQELQDGQRKTIAEVFDDEGTLKGVGQLEKFTFDKTVQEALIADIWKDRADRFYVIDKRDAPVVRIGRIKGL